MKKALLLLILFFSSQVLADDLMKKVVERMMREEKIFSQKLPLKLMCSPEIISGLARIEKTNTWEPITFKNDFQSKFTALIAKSNQLKPELEDACIKKWLAHDQHFDSKENHFCLVLTYINKEGEKRAPNVEYCSHGLPFGGEASTVCGEHFVFVKGTYINATPAYFANFGSVTVSKGKCVEVT